ncbi:phage major capsid protein [Macromonas nakdongensis]|uniref:phage major capsid protein n=1 Tax=Macromonas nakdongensis TaxID=1843082 RepID=UPI0018E3A25C|nr:phage major capsid protein [Macromonas nakdongensis]
MQLTRKHLTFAFLGVVALMAAAALAGYPLVDPAVLAAIGVAPMAMSGEIDLKEINRLLEEQGKAYKEFKETNDKRLEAKADAKAVGDFEAKLGKLSDVMDAIKEQVKEMEKKAGRPATGGDTDPVRAEHKQAFGKFLRKGDDNGLGQLQQKAYNITTEADGGYAVPEELDRDILNLMVDVSPIREIANVRTVSTSDYKKLVNTRGTASGWVDEDDARTATASSVMAQVTPFMGEIYAYPQATQQMLDDVFFNAEQFIVDECAQEFAQKEGAAFVTGDGAKKPKGFLAYTTAATADGARAFGTLEHLATGVSGGWAASNPADILIALVYKLKAGMRANARWVMNKGLLAEVRTFKDAEGNYLWRPGLEAGQPDRLLGYGLTEAEDMPAKAANSLSVAFGDFRRGYTIVDRIGTRVLRDPYTNKPYVGFYVTKRVGGMVVDSQAIKLLKFGTT